MIHTFQMPLIQYALSMLAVSVDEKASVWMRKCLFQPLQPLPPVSWKSSGEQVVCTLNVGCLCLGDKAYFPAIPAGIVEILRRTGTVYSLSVGCV